jgi:hypothetical protein
MEMDLDELAGHERERRAIRTLEAEMTHGWGEHVARGEAELEMVHRGGS